MYLNPCNEVSLRGDEAYAPRIEPGSYRIDYDGVIRIIGYCHADPRFLWVEVRGAKRRIESHHIHLASLEPLSPLEQLGAEGMNE
jgi:hypothetical protein